MPHGLPNALLMPCVLTMHLSSLWHCAHTVYHTLSASPDMLITPAFFPVAFLCRVGHSPQHQTQLLPRQPCDLDVCFTLCQPACL
ncbi:hypothetical protein V8C86DRAFT_2832003, partial [Haematococcus lacustris]